MYSFTSMVRFSETDESGNLSLIGLMNYLQDCCLFQSESLGVGPENLKERHRLWLLSGWQIVIDRYPKMFEKITVETIPYAFTGCLGWWNVLILDEQGNSIVRANSPWVFLNTDTGRPERPDELERAAYQIAETPPHLRSEAGRTGDIKNASHCAGAEERIPMEYAPRKIRLPEEMQECEAIPVIQEFIDSNHHVNNARYVEIAVNLVKEWEMKTGFAAGDGTENDQVKCGEKCETPGGSIKELRVEYKRQAQLGDVLYSKIGVEDDWNYVALENREGSLFASVALRK